MHISEESHVADHCSVYATSDPLERAHRKICSHEHNERCGQCDALENAIDDIEELLLGIRFQSDDDRDEALYLHATAKRAIQSWKCHQLRTVRQDQARLDILDILDEETVLIVNDWAMKFIPQKYRECQSDWFGKRGLSWHISVVYRRVNSQLQSQSFIHIIQSCSQDSDAVVKIMHHVLQSLKKEHPKIAKAFFRQDNAGCYHSALTILSCPSLAKTTGIKIEGLDFSDPQGGKGPADRMAATAKSHIRLYINEGHDVVTAVDMRNALLSHGGIEGVRVVALENLNEPASAPDQPKIPGISKLNNYRYVNDELFAWRAYGIGSGKKVDQQLTTGKYF